MIDQSPPGSWAAILPYCTQITVREDDSPAQSVRKVLRWGVLWRSDNRLDGKRQHIMFRDQMPAMFRTRQEAREWIDTEYGYIANRKDLQREPHGWSKPIPVRLEIGVRAINRSAS